MILKFDPSIPDFVNRQKEHGQVPDFLYSKDEHCGSGLILVVEMSSESEKPRTEVRNQLQSRLDSLAKLLSKISGRDWNSLQIFPVYCSKYYKTRRRKIRKATQYVTLHGKSLAVVKLKRIDAIEIIFVKIK